MIPTAIIAEILKIALKHDKNDIYMVTAAKGAIGWVGSFFQYKIPISARLRQIRQDSSHGNF